jgi:hypothetical protein
VAHLRKWQLLIIVGITFLLIGISLAISVISINAYTNNFHADALLEEQLLGASVIIALFSLFWVFLALLYWGTEQATK